MILVRIYKKLTHQCIIHNNRYNLKSNTPLLTGIKKSKKANKLAQAKTYSKRSPLEDVGT